MSADVSVHWEGGTQQSHTVQCVKDGEPSIQRGGGGGTPTISQGVETDVDLAYQVVSAVRIVVHQPV